MHYLLSILLLLSSLVPWSLFAYTLDDNDYLELETAEERLLDVIETNDHRNIEKVIRHLESILQETDLAPRQTELLAYLLDTMYRYTWYDADGNPYVLSEDDCYEDEYFDAEDQRCYLIDEDYTETDTDFWYDEVYTQQHSDDVYILASYSTKDTFTLAYWTSDTSYIQAWKAFSSLFPQRYLSSVSQVDFYDDPESETAGFIERGSKNAQQRVLTLNMDEVRNGDTTELYIHEMAHILTLESSQLTLETPDDASDRTREQHAQICQTHYTYEWCLQSNSYFYAFVSSFWSEEMLDAIDNEEDIYVWYEDNFVTEYAATNPWEDIAESFAFFVTKPREHGVSGEAWEKIDFFYAYKELIELRAFIRSSLE